MIKDLKEFQNSTAGNRIPFSQVIYFVFKHPKLFPERIRTAYLGKCATKLLWQEGQIKRLSNKTLGMDAQKNLFRIKCSKHYERIMRNKVDFYRNIADERAYQVCREITKGCKFYKDFYYKVRESALIRFCLWLRGIKDV
jgi:hypothetical protein